MKFFYKDCLENHVSKGYTCEPLCPQGWVKMGNTCEQPCPPESTKKNGKCVSKTCPPNTENIGDKCYDACPENTTKNETDSTTCLKQCNQDEEVQGTECHKTAYSCSNGTLIGDKCYDKCGEDQNTSPTSTVCIEQKMVKECSGIFCHTVPKTVSNPRPLIGEATKRTIKTSRVQERNEVDKIDQKTEINIQAIEPISKELNYNKIGGVIGSVLVLSIITTYFVVK